LDTGANQRSLSQWRVKEDEKGKTVATVATAAAINTTFGLVNSALTNSVIAFKNKRPKSGRKPYTREQNRLEAVGQHAQISKIF
jgi:hypothetical protein